jgi:hypothetical protein
MVPTNSVAAAAESRSRIELALLLAFLHESNQSLGVTTEQGPHHSLGDSVFGSLQFTDQHPWHPRMLDHKLDMRQKDGFDSCEGRGSSLRGFVDSCEQAFRHPFHDRLQDSVFAGKVPEQSALGQSHPLGNGGGGNVSRILFRRQCDQCPHRVISALFRWKVLRMSHTASIKIDSN